MSANQFGNLFKIMSFGESHGIGLGVVIDGCPAGVEFDLELISKEMDRRRPGSSNIVSGRNESDIPEIISGVFEGKTLGTPICLVVNNKDAKSEDYDKVKNSPRPGHADDTWKNKFGHVDHRGGGRSSGRETLSRVLAGAVAQMVVKALAPEISIFGSAKKIGPYEGHETQKIEELLVQAKETGESYGGTAHLEISGVPLGLGQPVFHKLKSDLSGAMMSVGATCGIEFGDGQAATEKEGSEFHDPSTSQRQYGGIRGGISTGEPISLNVFFKPTSSVLDIAKQGRHDPCIVPRAIPVLEAMAWLVVVDHMLWQKLDRV